LLFLPYPELSVLRSTLGSISSSTDESEPSICAGFGLYYNFTSLSFSNVSFRIIKEFVLAAWFKIWMGCMICGTVVLLIISGSASMKKESVSDEV